jgi:hypothetical protein
MMDQYKGKTRAELFEIIEGLESQITFIEDNLTLAVDLLYERDLDTYLEAVEAKEMWK